jgi:hypothetical protein
MSTNRSTISTTTLFYCRVHTTEKCRAMGGALAMNGSAQLAGCCSHHCHSDDSDGFALFRLNGALTFVYVTVVSASASKSRTLTIGEHAAAHCAYANFTDCQAPESGSAFVIESQASNATVQFLTVVRDIGDYTIDSWSSANWSIGHSHCYNNSGDSVVYCHDTGLTLKLCFFSGNTRDLALEAGVTNRFQLIDCTVSGGFSSENEAALQGTGNQADTTTASINIRFSTDNCPTPPPSSRRFSVSSFLFQCTAGLPASVISHRSRTAIFSCRFHASQLFTIVVSAALALTDRFRAASLFRMSACRSDSDRFELTQPFARSVSIDGTPGLHRTDGVFFFTRGWESSEPAHTFQFFSPDTDRLHSARAEGLPGKKSLPCHRFRAFLMEHSVCDIAT